MRITLLLVLEVQLKGILLNTHQYSIIPVAELESVKCRIFSLISISSFLNKFIKSLQVRALGMQDSIE